MKKITTINEAEAPEVQNKPEAKPEAKEQNPTMGEDVKQGEKTLRDIINLPYGEFIKKLTGKNPPEKGESLAEVDSKVVKVLNLGKKDLKLDDEKVPVTEKNIPAKNLYPTQSQIGLLDSIGFLAFVKPEKTKNPLSGQADFGGERILTANGKYILDGHHRWSGTYILNPNANIPCLDITLNAKSETELLKVIQMAIASTYGAIVMKSANAATDIYNNEILTKWNSQYKIEGDTTLGLLKAIIEGKCGLPKAKGADQDNVNKFIETIKTTKKLADKESVEKYLSKNADDLKSNHNKPEGAPLRSIMPQPDDTAKSTGKEGEKIDGIPADFVNKLKSGDLNFKAPFLDKSPVPVDNKEKVGESHIIKTYEKFIQYKGK